MTQPSDKIKAKVLDHLIQHLQNRTDVQNIDLMNLANFCRNCLSKWTVSQSDGEISLDEARKWVYDMDYGKWKEQYQLPATPEQLEKFNNRKQ
ncbi:DUF1244 domain-containing protein [Alphaproteobacteria bacterium]|nr:DUF1244 domain-containing protein [Alphaproteobacteria bacterium]